MNAQIPLREILKGVDSTDDNNIAYILAASINLYAEAIRRVHGRVILHPGDVRKILEMAHTMICNPPEPKAYAPQPARDRGLTSLEESALLAAVDTQPMRRPLDGETQTQPTPSIPNSSQVSKGSS